MEILGHSQIALTMNTYSHVAPEVSRDAAERMAGRSGKTWAMIMLASIAMTMERINRSSTHYAWAARDSDPDPAD